MNTSSHSVNDINLNVTESDHIKRPLHIVPIPVT